MTPLVERLARVLGVWEADGDGLGIAEISVIDGSPRLFEVCLGEDVRDADESTAMLALLAYARGLEVDMGPCPACVERGGRWDWERHSENRMGTSHFYLSVRDGGWATRSRGEDGRWRDYPGPHRTPIHCVRPCPKCSPDFEDTDVGVAGRDVRPLVRVLLDSMQRDAMRDERGDSFRLMGNGYAMPVVNGDPDSRTALAVKADELAQAGDPLAELLAAFLGGECRACADSPEPGFTCGSDDGWDGPCLDCHSNGTVLGALAPTLEEVAAEEWRARVSDDAAFDVVADALRSLLHDGRYPFTPLGVQQVWRDVEARTGLRLADHGLGLELGSPEAREIIIRRTTVLPGEILNITVNATLGGA